MSVELKMSAFALLYPRK